MGKLSKLHIFMMPHHLLKRSDIMRRHKKGAAVIRRRPHRFYRILFAAVMRLLQNELQFLRNREHKVRGIFHQENAFI